MSKRKAIYLLRQQMPLMTVTGRLTFDADRLLTEEARRRVIARIVQRLRAIGIEATAKQQEIRRG